MHTCIYIYIHYVFLVNVVVSSFPSGQFQTWVWAYPLNWLSNCSLVPGTWNVHAWRAWYLFSCDHDAIKIGLEYFRTERQHFVCYSTNFAFNARCVWYSPLDTCSKLPATFALFPVLSLRVCPRIFLPGYPLRVLTWEKVPNSIRMHNFRVP